MEYDKLTGDGVEVEVASPHDPILQSICAKYARYKDWACVYRVCHSRTYACLLQVSQRKQVYCASLELSGETALAVGSYSAPIKYVLRIARSGVANWCPPGQNRTIISYGTFFDS